MLKPALLILLLLPSLPTHALDIRQIPPEQLLKMGRELADYAGSNQWQQLWHRTRAAGHLLARPGHAHFTIEQPQLPRLAYETLANAGQVEAVGKTLALYRRSFPGKVLGRHDKQSLSALCLVVDWRSLPQTMADWPHAYLRNVSLMHVYPCG
ncbi:MULTISPECIES: hypothetical protein [Pseudomonas]|jgi:hypothetical protein|uniref:Uncharacterized protein n=1 Tax=Pseudomonas putida TaxID=303 RepID=A0A7Y7Z7B1_PSEPU|nr:MULTISPECIES: hypothetical protein [Pseudomonas]QPN47749.1 hypothetical protein I5S86_12975 [Priestia aryabhattai]KAF1311666.1 hypothetical protein BLX42_07460 [Pseudomonas sp. SG-MS2]MBG6128439.1 hypothetical protein [Pseudomonas sp. M2]MBM7395849.1 hypothetical protein [Pseudomonas sp. M5]NSX19617.1 hypothetical protein [Pseudomonas putida]